eukprot:CAMPEP_0197022990 /NCGR_PEP_ID=MMETSP1384-20130603/3785_1 /TAXON_ID=29189 /ORGANISM="Ammonia sp." /LENGTH=141 /DNA_ID=CAMNT_0042451127 /DNA_START=102 /DNA_END=527 /DNA_ORIENTATION=+
MPDELSLYISYEPTAAISTLLINILRFIAIAISAKSRYARNVRQFALFISALPAISGADYTQIGEYTSCAVVNSPNYEIKCWGHGYSGPLRQRADHDIDDVASGTEFEMDVACAMSALFGESFLCLSEENQTTEFEKYNDR